MTSTNNEIHPVPVKTHIDEKLNEKAEGAHRFEFERFHTPGAGIIRDIIFGFNDGLVSTFTFVMGFSGAVKSASLVLTGGLAAAIAGAISMALGAYLSTKSQTEYYRHEVERERREIELDPEYEKKELDEIYARKGFSKKEIGLMVKRVSSDKELFLKAMLEDELGLLQTKFDSPYRAGLVTGGAFVLGAIIPVFPYLFVQNQMSALFVSAAVSLLALLCVGAVKTKYTGKNPARSAIEMALIGVIAGAVSYLVGSMIPGAGF